MGLEMYLNRKIDDDEYGEIGCWRKANAIHAWFIRNIQNGVDNCRPYLVTNSKLRDLLMVCELVIYNPAMSSTYLPTIDGYFFGSVDYDEKYMWQLKHTVEILKEAIKDEHEIYYKSSW
jgi:hypothetical protein